MGIGASIFLFAVGAILTFATNFAVSGIDIDVVGIILMIAGVVGLIVTLFIWGPRRRAPIADYDDDVVTERRVYRDRGPY
jgi:hypothetical protein